MLVGAIVRHGLPLDSFTWGVLIALAALGSTVGLRRARFLVFPVVLAAAVYILAPRPFLVIPLIEQYSLFDDRGAREGVELGPGLRFGQDGSNTALLEGYLGPLLPNWWRQAPSSPYGRDGNERVQSRNVIRFSYCLKSWPCFPRTRLGQRSFDV